MDESKNPKIRQLLATARDLFMRYGLRRVTIEEICRTANVSKMTFYKHFRNKTDLTKHLIQQMVTENMARYREIMNQDIPFAAKVEKTIDMKLEQARDVSLEYFRDVTQISDPEIAEFVAEKRQEAFQEIFRDYTEAQEKGNIREDLKPEFILYFFNHIIEMIADERLVQLYGSPDELIMELTKFFFYGILPRQTGAEET
jgi:AcrR family transcriptional regulator